MLGPEDVLVERAPKQQAADKGEPAVNLLTHNRPYDIGRTACISCEPAELHFRGFAAGQPVRQTIQLRNSSARQTRVTVVPPTSRHFKVVEQHGGGSLAPGLCQELVVEFSGQQLQHYQDTIMVLTEDGGLAIPLQAYPLSGSPPLPKHLDMGQVPLGETGTHQLQLHSSSGFAVDFTVTVLQHNKHYTVSPLSGTVPAHGSAAVTLTFTPTKHTTELLQLQVQLAEPGAEPMPVLVSGCCKPGLVQQKVMQAATAGGGGIQAHEDGARTGSRRHAQDQTARSPAAHSSSPKRRAAGSPSMLPDSLVKAQRITQHDVNMLLNQRPGKLQIKDIKAAIVARKQELATEQQLLQAALDAGVASGIDPLDQPDIQADIKEALFQMQLSQAEASARHSTGLVSGKDGARVGSTPPTPAELESMAAVRAAMLADMEARKQEAAVHRLRLELKPSGAVHILPDPADDSSAAGSSGSSGDRQTAGTNSSHTAGYAGLESFRPQWLLLSESNDWRKRVQVAQRFVHAARVIIYRNRAQARLRQLRALGARMRGSKDGLAAQVLQDLVVGGSVVQRPGVAPCTLMVPGRVRPTEVPQHCPQAYVQHQEVGKGLYGDFSALQPQPYQAEFEYKLLGYTEEEAPSLLSYVPLCLDQPLLPGAAEDLPGQNAARPER